MKNTVYILLSSIALVSGVFAETAKQIVEQAPSTTVTSPSTDPVFSKDRVADCKVPCLNNVAVPVFRSVTTGLRQFYVHPKPIVNRDSLNTGLEEVRAAAKAMGNKAGVDQRYTLKFSISLMHPKICEEIAADLASRATPSENTTTSAATNFSNIKASEIAILPYNTIQITAEYGSAHEEKTIHSDPEPSRAKPNTQSTVTDRPSESFVSLTDTLAELEAFGAAPLVHVYTTSGAFSVKKNFVVVAAEKFIKSRASQALLGKDELKNEFHIKNRSSGGGFAVSLPFVGGGKTSTENSTDATRIIQRWVSRQQVLDDVASWGNGLGITEWEEIAEKDIDATKKESIIKQLVEFVLTEQKSAAFKLEQIAENKIKLTNQVTKETSVHAGSIASWKLDTKPSTAISAEHDGSFEYGPLKVADKGSFKLDAHDEVAYLEQGSYGFVPTTVNLYQITENDLRSRVVAFYEKFVSIKQEFNLHSESAPNVEVYDSNISKPGQLGLVSLGTLQSSAEALKAEQDSLRNALGSAPAAITISNVRVAGDADNGSRNLTCPPGTFVSGIGFGYNKGGPHGIVHHVIPICKPFFPTPSNAPGR